MPPSRGHELCGVRGYEVVPASVAPCLDRLHDTDAETAVAQQPSETSRDERLADTRISPCNEEPAHQVSVTVTIAS